MRRAVVLAALAACRLDPLVDDVPGASKYILPAGAVVPKVTDSVEVRNQIELNDGLDDTALAMANGVIARGTGMSAGAPVRYWAFGPATRAPAPLYLFFRDGTTGLQPIAHLPLLGVLPGDAAYNPMHTLHRVVVTDTYAGELVTTVDALNDAVELGLVRAPEAMGTFMLGPIVVPGTTVEVGIAAPAAPTQVYARGYVADMFRFGGEKGIQPGSGLVAQSQVSFVREQTKPAYDATRPIFQATIPAGPPPPPPMRPSYTPLSAVVNVDLAPGVMADSITQDADLFTRNAMGAITGTTTNVLLFTATPTSLVLQLQFEEGMP